MYIYILISLAIHNKALHDTMQYDAPRHGLLADEWLLLHKETRDFTPETLGASLPGVHKIVGYRPPTDPYSRRE